MTDLIELDAELEQLKGLDAELASMGTPVAAPPTGKKAKKPPQQVSVMFSKKPSREAVMPTGLPSSYEGMDKQIARTQMRRQDLIEGLASGDPARKRDAIEGAKAAYLAYRGGMKSGLESRIDQSLEENAVAWVMGDKKPSALRQGLAAANRALGTVPALAVGNAADLTYNALAGARNLGVAAMGGGSDQLPYADIGDTFLEAQDARRFGNAESQVFDRFDKRGVAEKAGEAVRGMVSKPGEVLTGLAQSFVDPSEMGIEMLTGAAGKGLGAVGKLGRLPRVVDAVQATRLGRLAAPTAEIAAGAALQPFLERGDVTAEDMASGMALGSGMHGASRLLGKLADGKKAKLAPKAPAAVAHAASVADDAGAFNVEDLRSASADPATASAAPAGPIDETAMAGFRRAVGAGATRDPATGIVTYGTESVDALREAIVKGRAAKPGTLEHATGQAAEELVNSHAQVNPENWADQITHAEAMGERYALGGGTQTFAHTPADALVDMAPAKAEAPKAPTPAQQAKINEAMGEYIKSSENLDEVAPALVAKRAKFNKFLADKGLLPEDAHQGFRGLSSTDAELNRIREVQARKKGEVVAQDRTATQTANDIRAVEVGEALLDVQLRNPAGAKIMDKAGTTAIADALEADARVGGGFRDRLVDQFGEEAVSRLEKAAAMPSNRHEWMKGALTGEDPLEAILNKEKRVADEAVATEQQTAQREAEKVARAAKTEAEQKEKDRLKEEEATWDKGESDRYADEQRHILFKDDIEALARMQPVVQIDKKTGKPKPSTMPAKQVQANAAEGKRLGAKVAKLLSESETLAAQVSDKLPAAVRSEFDDLMKSIRNMDGKNESGMKAMASFLARNSTALSGKFSPGEVQRPRPFPKKARPSQD